MGRALWPRRRCAQRILRFWCLGTGSATSSSAKQKARLEHEYGAPRGSPQPYYRLHGGKIWVDYDSRSRVTDFGFTTPYYRTRSGFGVGSKIPLGPCHTTPTNACEHRWHGFVYNPRLREKPCGCWVKVGTGRTSLNPSGKNYEKPWFFINLRQGHVSGFYFASRYID
jgi:hypothetical protein